MSRIPEYPWLSFVDYRAPRKGEIYLFEGHVLLAGYEPGQIPKVIVAPANDYGVYRLKDIEIPEGYEPDGDNLHGAFRPLQSSGGLYVSCLKSGELHKDEALDTNPLRESERLYRLFVRPIKPKMKTVIVVEIENPSQEDYNYICARLYEGKFNVKTEERPL